MASTHQDKPDCPVEVTLRIISGRWKVLVLHFLFQGTHRFNELQRKLGKITQRTLTVQLRELEGDGMIDRRVYPEVPPRVEYSLTPLGRSIEPILLAMESWAIQHAKNQSSTAPEEAQPMLIRGQNGR